ncbi:MAG: hypothetical protein HY700_05155 [Gemmatimonadetes bacterium]|nr:hypothetical protein [Gemmatimonadota bacterium]
MGKINWGRVLAGGLLAGLVLNIGDFLVNGVALSTQWNAALQALGKSEMSPALIAWFVLYDFLAGIFLVWLYAAIRPRFGAGPRTAVYAGLAFWALAGLLHGVAEAPLGLFPMNLYLATVACLLVLAPVAAVAGAWVYKEETATTSGTAASSYTAAAK